MSNSMSMKISSLSAIVAVSLLVSFGAAADTPATTEQTISGDSGSAAQEKKSKRKKRPKKICKREKVTGSNMKKRVCRSQAQMDAQAERDQDFVRSIQRPAGTSGSN